MLKVSPLGKLRSRYACAWHREDKTESTKLASNLLMRSPLSKLSRRPYICDVKGSRLSTILAQRFKGDHPLCDFIKLSSHARYCICMPIHSSKTPVESQLTLLCTVTGLPLRFAERAVAIR